MAGAVEALETMPYEKQQKDRGCWRRETLAGGVLAGKEMIVGGWSILHGGAHSSTLGPMSTFPKRKHSHFN